MTPIYDIAVLGATPAGYAAAYVLARKGRQVALVDAPQQAAESPLADWVPRDFFKTPGLPKTLQKACKARQFDHVIYHNADLTQQVEYSSRGTIGYFVQAKELREAFRGFAVRAGVKIRVSRTHPSIRLGEDHADLVNGVPTRGKLLLIAYNRPSDVFNDLSLSVQTLPQPPMVVAALDVPLGSKSKLPQGALHVVELRERSDLGMFFVLGNRLHLRLMSASAASGTRAEELSSLLTHLQRSAILPPDLVLGKAAGAVWYPPAGMALELETHVAKRCLLIGTAGGFAESITGQTIYPGVKSAMIASEMAQSALNHDNTQEDLMRFKTTWRKSLADYLRPPSTSLQMLLPLLFVNQRIVAKFTRALLFGESI